jgi:hypothetical protein
LGCSAKIIHNVVVVYLGVKSASADVPDLAATPLGLAMLREAADAPLQSSSMKS